MPTEKIEPPFELVRDTGKFKQYQRKVPQNHPEHPNLYNSEDIYVFDGLVIAVKSEQRAKVYRSGKVGIYFVRTHKLTYSARQHTKDGEPMFRIRNTHGDFTGATTYNPDNYYDAAVAGHVVDMVKKSYNIDVPDEWMNDSLLYRFIAYPMYSKWVSLHRHKGSEEEQNLFERNLRRADIDGFRDLSRGFLRSTPRAFVEQAFGKRMVDDALIDEVMKCNNSIRIATIARYRSCFTPETGIEFLRSGKSLGLDLMYSQNVRSASLRPMVRSLSADNRRLFALLNMPVVSNSPVIESMKLVEALVERNAYNSDVIDFQNWETIHTTLVMAYRANEREVYAQRLNELYKSVIEQNGYYQVLDGTTVSFDNGVYTIKSAQNVGEIIDWGDDMDNDIGAASYGVMNNYSYAFALYRDEEMFANMELSNTGRISHLYGRDQTKLDKDFQTALKSHLDSLINK